MGVKNTLTMFVSRWSASLISFQIDCLHQADVLSAYGKMKTFYRFVLLPCTISVSCVSYTSGDRYGIEIRKNATD